MSVSSDSSEFEDNSSLLSFNSDIGVLSTEYLTRDVEDYFKRPDVQGPLREAHKQYHLDDLLLGMIKYAPSEAGKRYILETIHRKQNVRDLINLAHAWLTNLFLPMLTLGSAIRSEPSSHQTPTLTDTAVSIESSKRNQNELREKVAQREDYRCAITGAFDRKEALKRKAGDVPPLPQMTNEAAHIIPFSLNKFSDEELKKAAKTWDMLKSWTSLDIEKLVGDKINSSENAIFMTWQEHRSFGNFDFYLDEDPNIANRYKVKILREQIILSNGQTTGDVQFRNLEGIEAPNPEFLRIHAAFAKVLHLSGAAGYFDIIERGSERDATGTDFMSAVSRKLEKELLFQTGVSFSGFHVEIPVSSPISLAS